MTLVPKVKDEICDHEFDADVVSENYSKKRLTRLFAVSRVFRNVDFSMCEIDHCYFRNSKFIDCDFTGTEISNSNFRGAQFDGCIFKYSEWRSTYLDVSFLDSCLPSEENLARDLTRSLRVNFAQVGNYEAVNRAASVEVKLTGQHLFNAAFSKQSYHRYKYKGVERLRQVFAFSKWKILDLLWGNGESLLRILLSAISLVGCVALIYSKNDPALSFVTALTGISQEVWGIKSGLTVGTITKVLLVVFRFLFFSLFMAVLVKRLSRR